MESLDAGIAQGSEDQAAMESANVGIVFLLIAAANSEQLRRDIEQSSQQGTRLAPTVQQGIKKDKDRIEKATPDDVITRKDFEANGIVSLADWPKGKLFQASGKKGKPGMQGCSDKTPNPPNRHVVVNLQGTLERAHKRVQSMSSVSRTSKDFDDAFESAKEEVRKRMEFEGRNTQADQKKLVARTVLYLIQMMATILWWVSG